MVKKIKIRVNNRDLQFFSEKVFIVKLIEDKDKQIINFFLSSTNFIYIPILVNYIYDVNCFFFFIFWLKKK